MHGHLLIASTYQVCRVPVLAFIGALTATTLADLYATLGDLEPGLTRLLQHAPGRLVIDMSAVSHCDRVGWAMLTAVSRTVTEADTQLRLAATPKYLSRVAFGAGSNEVPVFTTVIDAVCTRWPR